jgi:hypothetical protein
VCFPCSASFSNSNAKGVIVVTHPKVEGGKSGRIKRARNAAQGPIVMVETDIHEKPVWTEVSNYVDDSNDPPAGFQQPLPFPTLQNSGHRSTESFSPIVLLPEKFFTQSNCQAEASVTRGARQFDLDSVANGK